MAQSSTAWLTEEQRIEIVLEHLKVLRVEPGDVLVFRTDKTLPDATLDWIESEARKVFGEDQKVVVLADGMELEVVRQE